MIWTHTHINYAANAELASNQHTPREQNKIFNYLSFFVLRTPLLLLLYCLFRFGLNNFLFLKNKFMKRKKNILKTQNDDGYEQTRPRILHHQLLGAISWRHLKTILLCWTIHIDTVWRTRKQWNIRTNKKNQTKKKRQVKQTRNLTEIFETRHDNVKNERCIKK